MITTKSSCFFTALLVGDAAKEVVTAISPSTASDIEQVQVTSTDFSSDITALISFDASMNHLEQTLGSEQVSRREDFNPLYLPNGLEALDELVDGNEKSDHLRFTGFGGNPFVIKLIKLDYNEETMAAAELQYHPFELPSYSEIIHAHERSFIN